MCLRSEECSCGLDFWNNSGDIGPDRAPKMRTIVHRRVLETKSGSDRGELRVESAGLTPDGIALVREETRFIFSGTKETRTIERITSLTARDRRVVFRDNQEGTIGIRVARGLEQPSTTPDIFIDASGKATTIKVLDNTGVTGVFLCSSFVVRRSQFRSGSEKTNIALTPVTGFFSGSRSAVIVVAHCAPPLPTIIAMYCLPFTA